MKSSVESLYPHCALTATPSIVMSDRNSAPSMSNSSNVLYDGIVARKRNVPMNPAVRQAVMTSVDLLMYKTPYCM